MRTILFTGLIIILASCSPKKTENALENEKQSVKLTFKEYKTAVLNKNGNKALSYVNDSTIAYYDRMIEYAKTIISKDLQELSLLDKFNVLALRHRTTKEGLDTLDGKSTFIWSIDNGMVGEEDLKLTSIGNIEISGDTAQCQYVYSEKTTPYFFLLVKSDGKWKVDLTSFFSNSNLALERLKKSLDLTDQKFIYLMLETGTGKKVNPSIWYKMTD